MSAWSIADFFQLRAMGMMRGRWRWWWVLMVPIFCLTFAQGWYRFSLAYEVVGAAVYVLVVYVAARLAKAHRVRRG